MEEDSKRKKHRKKSKHKDYDDDFIEQQIRFADKQVERAMAQVKLAEKTAKKASKVGDLAGKLDGGAEYTEKTAAGMVISHGKTKIHIQSAENIQVGSNNTMVIMNDKRKSKKSSRRKKSHSSEDEEDVRDRKEEPRRGQDTANTEELDRLADDILKSERLATSDDLQLASQSIGSDWRRFLRFMGLEDAFLSQLQQEYYVEGIREVVYQGLVTWKRRYDKQATIGALTSTLKKVGYGGIVTNFKP